MTSTRRLRRLPIEVRLVEGRTVERLSPLGKPKKYHFFRVELDPSTFIAVYCPIEEFENQIPSLHEGQTLNLILEVPTEDIDDANRRDFSTEPVRETDPDGGQRDGED